MFKRRTCSKGELIAGEGGGGELGVAVVDPRVPRARGILRLLRQVTLSYVQGVPIILARSAILLLHRSFLYQYSLSRILKPNNHFASTCFRCRTSLYPNFAPTPSVVKRQPLDHYLKRQVDEKLNFDG